MERETARAVPSDPHLPGLGDLIPDAGAPQLVTDALRAWRGVEADPAGGSVAYVGYRPTLSCTVLWSFVEASGETLLVAGRRIRNGRGARVAARCVAEAEAAGRGPPCVYLPDHGLLLEAFPSDAKLPGLARAASPGWIEGRLAPALGLFGSEVRPAEPVSYRPWQRCVLRYRAGSSAAERRYFGKLFHDRQGERMVRVLQALGARLRSENAPWEVPRPVAYLPAERMLVTREMAEARKLNRLLRPARKDPAAREVLLGHVARAGEGLGFLQRSAGPRLPTLTPRDLLDDFRRTTARVGRVEPELAKRLGDALTALEHAAADLPEERLVPTHGAFRIDQLLPCRGKLGVLDLDTLCLSGESADAGNFLAYLDAFAGRRPRLEGVLAECRNTFEDACGAPSRRWLAWYRAASLVKVGFRAFLRLAPGWPATSDELFRKAHQLLAQVR
jgi:hypothetical protein